MEHRGIFRGLFLSSQQKTLHLLMRRLWGSGFDRCLALGLDSGFSYHYIQRFSFVYLFYIYDFLHVYTIRRAVAPGTCMVFQSKPQAPTP